MFGTVLDKATGLLDRSFMLGLLFPSLVFWGGVGALIATAHGWTASTHWWEALDSSRRWLLVVAAVAALVFFATLVGMQVTRLIRLLEGYWGHGPIVGRLADLGKRRQRSRRNELAKAGDTTYSSRYFGFPPKDEDFQPTRLGNVLRSAESYSGDEQRYGIDAVFFWPRLYAVLPDNVRSLIDEAQTSLDQMVVVSVLAALFAAVALGFAAFVPLVVWLPAAAGAVVVSRVAYVSGVAAATVYGDIVRSCFDLHRRTLLQALGFDLPANLESERAVWKALQQQLYRRITDRPELLTFRSG